MRLAVKAAMVCALGIGATTTSSGAEQTVSAPNPCGTLFCLQAGCPGDVDTWCAARVWGPCPGVNTCTQPAYTCGATPPSPWQSEVICGEGET